MFAAVCLFTVATCLRNAAMQPSLNQKQKSEVPFSREFRLGDQDSTVDKNVPMKRKCGAPVYPENIRMESDYSTV